MICDINKASRLFVALLVPVVSVLGGVHSVRADSAGVLHWYKGNTHTHTRFVSESDADGPPEFVAAWYRDHGYQFLVITDHEHLTDVTPLNAKLGQDGQFLVIPGQEITQEVIDDQKPPRVYEAHVNGINISQLITPIMPDRGPNPSPPQTVEEFAPRSISISDLYKRNMAEVTLAGGLPQVNHPNLGWSITLKDLLPLPTPFLFEVWNGYPFSNNLGGRDEAGHVAPSAEGLWDEVLSRGKKVWGVGSDDAHTYYQFDNPETPHPGKAWVVVRAPSLTAANIVTALREGQFYASTGIVLETYAATSKLIEIKIKPVAEWSVGEPSITRYITRFIGQNGKVLSEQFGLTARYRFKGTEPYVRASIIDSDGRRAWTQPVLRER
jgi:hypothetical protein